MVSVIIPTYNGEKTIARAINSILMQGVDVEILICDDCSTDNTLIICGSYIIPIFINSKHTGGANEGRNRGIKESEGEYITFLDQDDYFLPDKLKRQIKILEKGNDLTYSVPLVVDKFERKTDIYKKTLNYKRRDVYLSSLMVKNENIPLFKDYCTDFAWSLELLKNRRSIQTESLVLRDKVGLSKTEKYRLFEHSKALEVVKGNKAIRNVHGTLARFYLFIGKMKEARKYFRMSRRELKTLLYYILTFR